MCNKQPEDKGIYKQVIKYLVINSYSRSKICLVWFMREMAHLEIYVSWILVNNLWFETELLQQKKCPGTELNELPTTSSNPESRIQILINL